MRITITELAGHDLDHDDVIELAPTGSSRWNLTTVTLNGETIATIDHRVGRWYAYNPATGHPLYDAHDQHISHTDKIAAVIRASVNHRATTEETTR